MTPQECAAILISEDRLIRLTDVNIADLRAEVAAQLIETNNRPLEQVIALVKAGFQDPGADWLIEQIEALKWPVSPSTERVIGLAENPVRVIEKILEQAGLGDKIDREAINNMAVYADELVPIEILEMPFVTSPETAQRLATRYLKLKKSPPDA